MHDDSTTEPHVTVLLADDHPALRTGIRMHVDAADGMEVVGEASDGEEALSMIRAKRPRVALADLRMPKLDGMGLVTRVVEEGIETRIVLLSGSTENHLVQRALDLGAAGYVGKESPMEFVIEAIRAAATGGRYIDPTLVAGLLGPADRALTDRELQVLQLAADGHQNKAIAIALELSEETVKSHMSNVMRKLEATSRTDAVAAALRRSLIT